MKRQSLVISASEFSTATVTSRAIEVGELAICFIAFLINRKKVISGLKCIFNYLEDAIE